MTDRTLPPSIRAEKKAETEAERKAAQQEQQDRIKRAMQATFNTPDGLIVLNWLKDECMFGKPILGALANGIDEKATLYQAMRLNLYLKVRSFLTFEILKEVEYHADK